MRRAPGTIAARVAMLATVATLAAVRPAQAQPPAEAPLDVHGVVRGVNGLPIPRVEIVLGDSGLRTVTNDSGFFTLAHTMRGRVHFTARRLGYRPVDTMLELRAGENKELRIELDAVAELLDSVVVAGRRVSPRLEEFWKRRENAPGAFITREEIEQRRPYRPSDMLRMVPGVIVNTDRGINGRPAIYMGRTGASTGIYKGALGADCRVDYYVDGTWMLPGTFHIDDISASSIEGIEIFRGPSEIPAKFRQRETACGLIVIWTRDPSAPPGSI